MNAIRFAYILFIGLILFLDRLTKYMALSLDKGYHAITSFFSVGVVFNRGFSWSLFHSDESLVFFLVSALIIIVTLFLAHYAFRRYQQGHTVIGECLVLGGSFSNILDRLWYGGVVDFIILSYKQWYWPAFNSADACIVVGAMIMFWAHYE